MKKLIILTLILFTVQFLTSISAQTEQKPELVVQTGHTNALDSIIFSSTEKQLISKSTNNSVKIWDILSGKELKTFHPHTLNENVSAIGAFQTVSPDGITFALKGWKYGEIKLWNLISGQITNLLFRKSSYKLGGYSIPEQTQPFIGSVIFSPQGDVLAGNNISKISIWDSVTGIELKTLKTDCGTNCRIDSFSFSPSGKKIVASVNNATTKFWGIKIWNIDSEQELKTFEGHEKNITSVVFSPDEKMIASESLDNFIRIWDISTEKEITSIEVNQGAIFPPRNIMTGERLPYYKYNSSIKFSLNGKILITDKNRLYNVKTGQELEIAKPSEKIESIVFSPTGKVFASISSNKHNHLNRVITIRDAIKGNELLVLNGETSFVTSVTFSLDGKILAGYNKSDSRFVRNTVIKLWSVDSGKETRTLNGHSNGVSSVSFSPNKKLLASGGGDGEVKLWDFTSGNEVQIFKKHSHSWFHYLSPNGRVIVFKNLSSSEVQRKLRFPKSLKFWNLYSNQGLKTLEGFKSTPEIAFSSDSKTIGTIYVSDFSTKWTKTIKHWDAISGEELESYEGNKLNSDFLNYNRVNYKTANGRAYFEMGRDGKLNLFELNTGKLLASLLILNENNWAVTTPDGRFDTNKLENPEGLHWLLPDAPLIPLSFEVFMRDYFEPNLLPRLLRCTEEENCDEEFKPVRDLTSLNRTQPKVQIKEIKQTDSADMVEVLVEAENVLSEFQKGSDKKALDSGVFDLRLFRDGQLVEFSTADENLRKTFRTYSSIDEELKVWREANRVDLKDGKKTFSFEVKLPNDAVGKPIEFSAYAFNDDRVKSETSRKTFTVPKNAKLKPKPRKAYVITFGVNKYENPSWDLQFAGNDARAMREIVSGKLRVGREFAEVVEIPLISDDEKVDDKKTIAKRDATKGNVQTIFKLLSGKTPTAERLKKLEISIGKETLNKIKQSNPDDMVLMSFSSHGYADKNGIFYILPSDIGKDSGRKIDNEMLSKFISSDELSLWLRDVDAKDLVMIVDACYAASAVEGKDFKPAPMGSRGLGQLAFDKGMKILTATQAANVALESGGTIGHGLLTYALLRDGIDKYQADFKAKDKSINIKEWLEFGEFRVPKLYEELSKGNLKSVGRSSDIIKLDGEKNNASQQTPSLFDFTRKKQEMILTNVP